MKEERRSWVAESISSSMVSDVCLADTLLAILVKLHAQTRRRPRDKTSELALVSCRLRAED